MKKTATKAVAKSKTSKPATKKAPVKKYQDGGEKSKRRPSKIERGVSLSYNGTYGETIKNKKDGSAVIKNTRINRGYAGMSAEKSKLVEGADGKVISEKKKPISVDSAARKITRVAKNVGRNPKDYMKKGGTKKK